MGSLEVMVKSMLDLRQLETFAPKKNPSCPPHDRERQSSLGLQEPVMGERPRRHRPWPDADWLSSHTSRDTKGTDVLYPEEKEDDTSPLDSDYCRMQGRGIRSESQDSRSPDSACSLDYDSRESSPDHILDDPAEAEYLSQDSSDEENVEKEEDAERREGVTSMDEALRTITDSGGCDRADFLKQNFETLSEGCTTAEQSTVPRLSMSSRFLARGHNNRDVLLFAKANGKEQGGRSIKPPVSKVRPLMEDGVGGNAENKSPVSPGKAQEPKAPERSSPPALRPQKKTTTGSHLWRFSNPPPKASLLLDRTACIQKSRSAQDLATRSLSSPMPSSDQRELHKRPQQPFLNEPSPRPSSCFSSHSSGSPQSSQSPLPWESPKLKPQHSYMNPTASSVAKSRSSSFGDAVHIVTPPGSPFFSKRRRSSVEIETEPPVLASSPVLIFPSSVPSKSSLPLSNSPSLTPPHPTASQNVPPSRIPLPKQPLSPRRSLCLEVKPSSSWSGSISRASTPTTDPGCHHRATPLNKQALGRHLSLSLDSSLSCSMPVKQKRDSVSESAKEPGQVAVAKECPLVPEQAHTSSPQPDRSVTLETCRQVVTDLHSSLRKTVMLYTTVLQHSQQTSEDQHEMRSILSKALLTVKDELDSLPHPSSPQSEGPPGVNGDGEKALALLEQYAELLVKSVEKRLDTKT